MACHRLSLHPRSKPLPCLYKFVGIAVAGQFPIMRREKPHSCKARLRRNSRPEPQYNRHDMATEVNLDAVIEDLPDWQREAVKLARNVQEQEGKRYLALPDKLDVHEWAIMDRFSETLKDAQMRNDFHGGIRGVGAFRLFKHLLTEYNWWDAWNRFKQVEL